MKRKYFFIVLFLTLAMFFITNTFDVNAIIYKVLDKEGNVVGLTNQPFLSESEKEAGYTLDPPIKILKEKNTLTEELMNWGETWNYLSNDERILYCVGMRDGMAKGIFVCVEWMHINITNSEKSRLPKLDFVIKFDQYCDFLSSNTDVVIKVVSNLYLNPSNSYISITDMCFIAYQKLKGEDIEPLLRELREKALP